MDNLFSVAERFGTPCFVFDEVQLTRRMKAVRAIVPEEIRLCYSIKANPFLIPAMRRLVGTLEVCSPGELEICRQQGVSPDMVLFSGVNKTKADVERAMDLGVTRFTCESPLHVRLIDEAARSRGRVYPVLLRLTAGSQFGMDERDFFAALDHRAATPGIRIEGVHYFSGTQRKKLDGQRKELAMLCALADRLKAEYGMETVRVEYGPGLYFPYFSHEDHSDTLAPIRELAPDLAALAAHCELTIEMGRFFASECGAYLTRVVDTKVNGGTAYAIVDGGIHHVNYLGGNMGMRVPIIRQSSVREGEMQPWALCGSLCTTADVLVRKAELHPLEQGDVLHIAFGSGMTASVQNAMLAAESLREKYPERKLIVIDSLCSSSGYGLLVDGAADLRDEGKSMDEITDWVLEKRKKVHHQFYSTELKFYRRSGRMAGAAAAIGTVLGICPIMRLDDKGRIIAYDKVRGKKNAVARTVETMKRHAENGENYSGKAFICHSNCLADAKATKAAVEAAFPHLNGEVRICDIGTIVASHSGPGTVAVFFFGVHRKVRPFNVLQNAAPTLLTRKPGQFFHSSAACNILSIRIP